MLSFHYFCFNVQSAQGAIYLFICLPLGSNIMNGIIDQGQLVLIDSIPLVFGGDLSLPSTINGNPSLCLRRLMQAMTEHKAQAVKPIQTKLLIFQQHTLVSHLHIQPLHHQ